MDNIELKYIDLEQPIGTLYLTKIPANILNDITESNIRNAYNNPNGIQRKLSSSRVKSIKEYCLSGNAIFPTPIIISAPREYFLVDEEENIIKIMTKEMKKNSIYCSTVDGQHRLKGIEEAGMLSDFELPVIVGIGLNREQEIELFSTINGNQKPVNKSLLVDLYGDIDKPSLEKIGNTVAKVINNNENSMLKGKIKMLGVKDTSDKQYVSQATFVDGLLSLITNNRNADNASLKRGEDLSIINEDKYIFRDLVRKDEIVLISYVCMRYFNSVTKILNKYNFESDRFYKSIGFFALFYLMRDLYPIFQKENSFDESLRICFHNYFKNFSAKKYSSSLSGANALYEDLREGLIEVYKY